MKKRVISLILAVMMIVTLFPVSAFAMKNAVTITSQPQSMTVRPGETATFTVSATGGGDHLFYLWFDADLTPVEWLQKIAEDCETKISLDPGKKGTIGVSTIAAKYGIQLFNYYNEHPEIERAILGGEFEPDKESSTLTINNAQKTMHIQCIAVLNNKDNLSELASLELSIDTFLNMTDMRLTGYALSDVITLTVDPNAPCQNHTMRDVPAKEPTCTEEGWDAHQECSVCGYSTATPIPMLDHSYGEWAVSVEPGCTEPGLMIRTCDCGAVDTQEIAPKGHSYSDNWTISKDSSCTEDGLKVRYCAFCGTPEYQAISAEGHSFGDWVSTKAATCTDTGIETRYCAYCEATETRETEALGHSYKNGACSRCSAADPDFKPATPKISSGNDAKTGYCTLSWSKVTGAAKYEVYRATSKTGKYTKMSTTTKTTYTNTSSKAGTTYYYKVRAISAAGVAGGYSTILSRACDCAQPVVTATNVASTGKVKLTWKAVTGATKYEVYRATSKTGTFSKIYTTTKTSLTNTSTTAGKTYYYKVKAIAASSSSNSAFSDVVSRTCDLAQPAVTVKLSSGHPKLSWDKVTGATKYEIYRATSKTGTYTKLTTTTKTSLTNTSAVAGKTYYYKVRAICGTSAAASAYSSVVSIKAK